MASIYDTPEPDAPRWDDEWQTWAKAVEAEVVRFTDDYYSGDVGEAEVAVAELLRISDQAMYEIMSAIRY